MAEPLMAAGEVGDQRRAARDERREPVTNGAGAVTNGKPFRPLLRAYALWVPLILLATAVNISSAVYDLHRGGRTLPLWEPFSWELSSGVSVLVAVLVLAIAARLAPIERGWRRALAIHIAATLPFSAIHTGGMFSSRWLVYRLQDSHYHASLSDAFYEYRKDLVTYAILYGAYWIATRPHAPSPAEPLRDAEEPADPVITIVDGVHTHRTPLSAILSLRAAGNYVEFHLDGGNRPLMRGSLQEMQEKLAAHGFVRTHRSWVVNPRRVRRLTALGSGDFTLTFDSGAEAPLSRRFPEALAYLRKKEGAALATPSIT